MSGGLLLLALAVAGLIAILAFLVVPRSPWELEEAPERFRSLERAYERTLRTIKDLEFDFQAGTLSREEHARLRAEYKEKAIAIRGALDRFRQAAARRIAGGKSTRLLGEEIEELEALVVRARAQRKA